MTDSCLVFFPDLTKTQVCLKTQVPSMKASDLIQSLSTDLESPLTSYLLIDTNMTIITDLTFYAGLPQSQVALFIMHKEIYKQGLILKDAEGFDFRNFCMMIKHGDFQHLLKV
jgi:hypothetical protein